MQVCMTEGEQKFAAALHELVTEYIENDIISISEAIAHLRIYEAIIVHRLVFTPHDKPVEH